MTQSIKKINHKHKKTVDVSKGNKTDTVKTIDKSSPTQRTDKENTFNKVNKSGYNSRTSLSNKITKIEKLSEIDISNDDLSISVLSGYWEILSSITPYQQRIPRKNKELKLYILR